MKTALRVFSLILALLMLLPFVAACSSTPTTDVIKSRGKIIMLTNAAFPPFEYTTGDGTVVGVDVDIAREIANDLGVELEIMDMAFEGIVTAIKSGKGDIGVAGMSVTEDRLKNVDFSVDYISSKLRVLVLATETEITTPDGLKNQSIGVQTGTTSDVFASGIEGATISRFGNFLDASTALKSGKVRAVVVDEMTSDEILAANSDIIRLDDALTEEKYAICIQKGNETLLEAINTTLNRLISEGKIDEFIFNHTSTGEG